MLEVGRVSPNTIRIFDTQLSNGLLVKKSNIKFMIDALTEIKEQLDEEEKEKQAQERKVNRAMERLEQIACINNYMIVDTEEHFILIDLDELTDSVVLSIDAIIKKLHAVYEGKIIRYKDSFNPIDVANNKSVLKVLDELLEIRKILVK